MRDPKRIPRVLEKLAKFWDQVPDWRLGQLVVNLTSRSDPFYVEDDILEAALDEELEKLNK
jgi:hypothetical protein